MKYKFIGNWEYCLSSGRTDIIFKESDKVRLDILSNGKKIGETIIIVGSFLHLFETINNN